MSPDDFPLDDDSCCFAEVQRQASSCGGTIIQETGDLHITTWSYNADGQLVGYMNTGDLGTPCEEGGSSTTVIYGFNCEPQGLPEDLCQDAGNACGAGGAGGAAGAGGGAG
jgi:hypothetical protein